MDKGMFRGRRQNGVYVTLGELSSLDELLSYSSSPCEKVLLQDVLSSGIIQPFFAAETKERAYEYFIFFYVE